MTALKTLVEASISVQAKQSLHHCPYFVRDGFEDRRFNQVAMDQLQFGRHDQLAADNAGFIGEALTISSLGAGLLSMLVHTALTASLFLVFRRTYKLSVDAATVGMICAGRATDEMLGLVLGRIVDAFTDVPTARNHFCGGSLWTNSGHATSTTARLSSEISTTTSVSMT